MKVCVMQKNFYEKGRPRDSESREVERREDGQHDSRRIRRRNPCQESAGARRVRRRITVVDERSGGSKRK